MITSIIIFLNPTINKRISLFKLNCSIGLSISMSNFVELLEDSELIKFNTEKMEELSQTCFSLKTIRDNLLKEDIKWFEERGVEMKTEKDGYERKIVRLLFLHPLFYVLLFKKFSIVVVVVVVVVVAVPIYVIQSAAWDL